MINGEVLYSFVAHIICIICLNGVLLFLLRRIGDNTYVYIDALKKKKEKLTRYFAIFYSIWVLCYLFAIVYVCIQSITSRLNLKCDRVQGTIISIDNVSKKYNTEWGTIYLRDRDLKTG